MDFNDRMEEEPCNTNGEEPYNNNCIADCDRWCSDFNNSSGELRLFLCRDPQLVPYLEVLVDNNFEYSVFVYGWLLSKTLEISKRILQNTPINDFLEDLLNLKLCPGLDSSPAVSSMSNEVISHVVPTRVEYKNNPQIPFNTLIYHRSVQCKVLGDNPSICFNCLKLRSIHF